MSLWLMGFCLSRVGFATIFTTYSAALPLLKQDWAMSASRAGVIQSAWHAGYLVSLFAVGFLSDHYGAKRTFLFTSVAASISALLFALFADGFVSGLFLYGLTGLCSGGSYTPGLALVSERFPAPGRGRAMGFYLAASSLGYALSLFLSSVLFPYGGWRDAFLVTASGPAVGTLLASWVLRHTPNVIHRLPNDHVKRGSLLAVARNKPALLAIWAYVFHSWELLGMWTWLPAYLSVAVAHGGSVTVSAVSLGVTLSAFTYLTSMAGSIAGGWLSDRWGRTLVILLMSCLSLLCSFTFGWLIGLPMGLLVSTAVIYNLSAIGDSSIYSTALTELVPPSHLGAAYSMRSVLGFGAGAVSPWVFGLVLDWARAVPLGSDAWAWGLAWTCLGAGALPGPLMTLKLRWTPESSRMAGGLR